MQGLYRPREPRYWTDYALTGADPSARGRSFAGASVIIANGADVSYSTAFAATRHCSRAQALIIFDGISAYSPRNRLNIAMLRRCRQIHWPTRAGSLGSRVPARNADIGVAMRHPRPFIGYGLLRREPNRAGSPHDCRSRDSAQELCHAAGPDRGLDFRHSARRPTRAFRKTTDGRAVILERQRQTTGRQCSRNLESGLVIPHERRQGFQSDSDCALCLSLRTSSGQPNRRATGESLGTCRW
jgi:hypothetical protein